MVYETETMKLCHKLTACGEETWNKLLEIEANRLLVESRHKALTIITKILNIFGFKDTFIQNRYDKLIVDMKNDI